MAEQRYAECCLCWMSLCWVLKVVRLSVVAPTNALKQGTLKGEVSLYSWPHVWPGWISLSCRCAECHLCWMSLCWMSWSPLVCIKLVKKVWINFKFFEFKNFHFSEVSQSDKDQPINGLSWRRGKIPNNKTPNDKIPKVKNLKNDCNSPEC
jgi:hypothetical protein